MTQNPFQSRQRRETSEVWSLTMQLEKQTRVGWRTEQLDRDYRDYRANDENTFSILWLFVI